MGYTTKTGPANTERFGFGGEMAFFGFVCLAMFNGKVNGFIV